MVTTQVSVFCAKFQRSSGNHICNPHPSKDSTARTVETWTRMGQSHQWRQKKAIKDWVEETELLGAVGVNRLALDKGLGDRIEVHVFCDASLEARAAVAYIKTTSNQRNTIRFLMGQTRVAPIRSQTRTASSSLCSKIEANKRG